MIHSLMKYTAMMALGAALATPACADEFTGTLIGAGIGGAVGSTIGHGAGRLAATGAGVFIGGAIGNELSRPSYSGGYYAPRPEFADMNSYPYDMFPPPHYGASYQANYVAPPDPQPATYIDADMGSYCRAYSQVVRIGNHVQESFGTACLQPDGSWHVVQ